MPNLRREGEEQGWARGKKETCSGSNRRPLWDTRGALD